MLKVRDCKSTKTKYRCYSPTSMTMAIQKIKETGAPIKTTAREFNLPEASLRHKLSGRVNPEATKSGPSPMFTQDEEVNFVEHLKFLALCGYGYSRSEVVDMASEYAACLNKRDRDHPLSFHWYTNFMSRWPELKIIKPCGLQNQRAKATTVECVSSYYKELRSILVKYNLTDKPERIYNVDEKGLSTSHNPPAVVTGVALKPVAVTSESMQTVTMIGCGNALGNSVPPFFVFPGSRMRQELLQGGCPGANGDVTKSGLSNSVVFRKYLSDHLLKYLPECSTDNPILILYDGHISHINISLINWAKSKNLILFILPAHTSHVLQPLDIGCFGPFERIYNKVSHKFMGDNCGQSISRYNICALGSSAYLKALSPENLRSSFKKAGIYPFNPNIVDASNFKPSEPLQQEEIPTTAVLEVSQSVPKCSTEFFASKEALVSAKKPPTKKRRCTVVSGKPITEDSI
ncbi:uncharacterized protein LOC132732593 [Ruditapes philippinarum]|uniref:uncharacterized protein LOC132732593 n=1 Tax=Ruditapes philippinarum TaxID=129788 RepID=UPI00295A7E52|nr:uncharacterized protein LOC132732593 [Ruditapes philippinarum]